jgi:hypothetical protein
MQVSLCICTTSRSCVRACRRSSINSRPRYVREVNDQTSHFDRFTRWNLPTITTGPRMVPTAVSDCQEGRNIQADRHLSDLQLHNLHTYHHKNRSNRLKVVTETHMKHVSYENIFPFGNRAETLRKGVLHLCTHIVQMCSELFCTVRQT